MIKGRNECYSLLDCLPRVVSSFRDSGSQFSANRITSCNGTESCSLISYSFGLDLLFISLSIKVMTEYRLNMTRKRQDSLIAASECLSSEVIDVELPLIRVV